MVRNRIILAFWVAALVAAAFGIAFAGTQSAPTTVAITDADVGMPPSNFEFAVRGKGAIGQWTVVQDQTAAGGLAIEHASTDEREDRIPLAIYQPQQFENVEVGVRFKIISGTMQAAGVAISLRSPGNFYAVRASALEHRVDLLLVTDEQIEQIASAEAEITLNRWHAMKVVVNDDHFVVVVDQRPVLTTFDRTRMKDGRVALLTIEDNVTRFDSIQVRALPATEWR